MEKEKIAKTIIYALKHGGKVIVCGNGGSAAESTHLVGEFLGKFEKDGRPLPAISLFDLASITAIANDYGYEYIFSRQLEALGRQEDVLVVLSTSGASPNVVQAIQTAKEKKMKVVRFPTRIETGCSTAVTQEVHLELMHEVMRLVEQECR